MDRTPGAASTRGYGRRGIPGRVRAADRNQSQDDPAEDCGSWAAATPTPIQRGAWNAATTTRDREEGRQRSKNRPYGRRCVVRLTKAQIAQLSKWANGGRLIVRPITSEKLPEWAKHEFMLARSVTSLALEAIETEAVWRSEWIKSPKKAGQLWQAARARALQRGLEFSISREWVEKRLAAGHCEVTGLPFKNDKNGNKLRNSFAPSIDRRDPAPGYIEANCRMVVWMYNCAKNDGSDDDVLLLASALVNVEARAAEKRLAARQAPSTRARRPRGAPAHSRQSSQPPLRPS